MTPVKRMNSIGTKFVFQIALVLIIVMIVFGGLALTWQRNTQVTALLQKEDRTVQQLALITAGLVYDANYEQVVSVVQSYLTDPEIFAVKILEREKVLTYFGKHPDKPAEIIDLRQQEPQYADVDRQQSDLTYNNDVIGGVRVVFSRHMIMKNIRQLTLLLVGGLVGLLLIESLVIFLLVRRNITTPLLSVVQAAHQMAAGDMTIHLQQRVSRDEIGQLVSAMHHLSEKIRAVVAHVKSAANHVATSSRQMSSGATQMSTGANSQAASIEEVSASMEQMAANIRQNTENAGQTEQIAIQAAADAQASGQAVAQAVKAMRDIAGKVAMIDDIARQTRMLSLNATIEAARAQEYGRGFAVVAAEVRSLSERSQAAAAEITELTRASVATAEQAGEMLVELVPYIQKTAELVQEISAASREQNTGTEQINRGMQQLDQVIQHNAATTEELASTAEELAAQAEMLQQTVAFFKTDVAAPVHAERSEPVATPTRPDRTGQVALNSSRFQPDLDDHGTNGNGKPDGIGSDRNPIDAHEPDLDNEFERY